MRMIDREFLEITGVPHVEPVMRVTSRLVGSSEKTGKP
jgi:hypothetical protein